jgi:hypothetical protein
MLSSSTSATSGSQTQGKWSQRLTFGRQEARSVFMFSELEHTFQPGESRTFRLGPYGHAGRVVFHVAPSDLAHVYVSSFRVGNRDRLSGSPGSMAPLDVLREMDPFPAGLAVTIEVCSTSARSVPLSLDVVPV